MNFSSGQDCPPIVNNNVLKIKLACFLVQVTWPTNSAPTKGYGDGRAARGASKS
jgi:hypothetical protein